MRPNADNKHVLVVEDDETCRMVVTAILASAGYRVTEADDFFSAIEVVESDEPIDVLLADIVMPAGTPHGIALGKMAKYRRHMLKVLLMSGSVDPTEYHLLGPDDAFLRKPFAPQQLIDAVGAAVA
jgi:DNA-binding NtrC family response regulator